MDIFGEIKRVLFSGAAGAWVATQDYLVQIPVHNILNATLTTVVCYIVLNYIKKLIPENKKKNEINREHE